MSVNKTLEYSYIRTEGDGKYTLFLKFEPSMLEKEVDIELTDTRQLTIKFPDGLTLSTEVLADDIYDSLANRKTLTVFTDSEGEFIANEVLDPLKPSFNVKKAKP